VAPRGVVSAVEAQPWGRNLRSRCRRLARSRARVCGFRFSQAPCALTAPGRSASGRCIAGASVRSAPAGAAACAWFANLGRRKHEAAVDGKFCAVPGGKQTIGILLWIDAARRHDDANLHAHVSKRARDDSEIPSELESCGKSIAVLKQNSWSSAPAERLLLLLRLHRSPLRGE
jgi:hypothetical protein